MVAGEKMKVLVVAAELAPYAKTGGLGDMVAALASALGDLGLDVTVLMPGYPGLVSQECFEQVFPLPTVGRFKPSLRAGHLDGIGIVAVECADLYDRTGSIYADEFGRPWPDNDLRFGLLGVVAALVASGRTPLRRPDVVHLHDWHGGAFFLEGGGDLPVVLTVHNFAFQGLSDPSRLSQLGTSLNRELGDGGLIFGKFSPLRLACRNATIVSTVSRGYAQELGTETRFNWYQIDRFDRDRLRSVPNWHDGVRWNPSNDQAIMKRYDQSSLPLKGANKISLCEELGMDPALPLVCTASRITKQKGFRFLAQNLDLFMEAGANLVMVGSGDPRLVNRI